MAPPIPPELFDPTGIYIDAIASLILLAISFAIFLRTREYYVLTGHEGIRYFRYAFLFFGITFLFPVLRFVVHMIDKSYGIEVHDVLFPVMFYIGTMAVLCLLYSTLWKHVPKVRRSFLLLSAIAIVVSALTFEGHFRDILLIVQLIAFLVAIVVSYFNERHAKRTGVSFKMYALYSVLFFSWIASTFARFAMRDSLWLSIALNALSVVLFALLFFMVARRTSKRASEKENRSAKPTKRGAKR